jgi:Transposase, Mutator family
MTEALGAERGERTAGRLGYRSGYYGRTLITRVGKLEQHRYLNMDDLREHKKEAVRRAA